jgi:putative flippase GtrA
MTVLYIIGAVVAYFGNRKLTFNSTDALWSSGLRYILVHSVGYAIDYTMLTVLHEQYGYAHQYVQICAVGVVAVYLFIAMKFFVFRATA